MEDLENRIEILNSSTAESLESVHLKIDNILSKKKTASGSNL